MADSRHGGFQWLGFLALAIGSAWHLLHGARVEVDDVFIVLRTAENFAAGHGLVFTPGDTFMPVTCPLWTLLLGAMRMLSPSSDLVESARCMSIGFLFATTILLFALLRRTLGWFATALGPLLLFAKEIPEHVGNEVGMATFFAAATMLAAQRHRPTLAAVAVGLFYLTRGEAALLAVLVFAPGVWAAYRRGELRAHLRALAIPLLALTTIVVTWHAYHLLQFGSVLPRTLTVKMLQGAAGWPKFKHRLLPNLWSYLQYGTVLVPFFLLGLALLVRRLWLLPAWAAVHVSFYCVLRVPNYDWYYYPLFTLTPVAILAGLAVVSRWATARIGILSATIASGLATVAVAVAWTPTSIPTANSHRFEQYRRIATWLETNAAVTPRPLVLAEEIGIIGYYAPSFPFVDPPGILVPDLTREQVADWRGLVCRRKPGVLIFAEDLGQEVLVRDRVHLLDHRYDRVATLPARDFLQHIYRRRL